MSWFNIYETDGACLTRVIATTVDLRELPLCEWTDDELAKRLAVIYPQVDGHEHETAPQSIKDEVQAIRDELTARGFVWNSNLIYNERHTGWGWLRGLVRMKPDSRPTG